MASTNTENRPVILITGSSGLIGTRLLEKLSGNYRVACLDVAEPEKQFSATIWFKCDMTDDASVASAMQEVKKKMGSEIASVIHLAAYYDFTGEPSEMYQELTVSGTKRLLDQLQEFKVEQFVFSSSLLVMQSAEDERPIDSDDPVEAEWDYPRSKLAAEHVIQGNRGDIPAVILRIAGVYDEDCHSLPIAQQMKRIHQKELESYFFPGDKTHGQSFIHLHDLVACFEKVIEKRDSLSDYEVFLIGEADVMSYEDLQEQFGQHIHGEEWPAIRIPKFAAKAGAWVKNKMASEDEGEFIKPWMIDLADQNYPIDIKRAQDKLQWKPKHSLRDSVGDMVDHLLKDPQKWYQTNNLPVPESVK
jgi:nucleoside-diphosphate-sugar epimerase